eukprot:13597162-Ditylum_brightwellii.AAC.1
MMLDFLLDGRVIVDMRKYVNSTLEDFLQDIVKIPPTPTGSNSLKVNDGCDKLPKKLARAFHTSTAKLLFLCNRGRPGTMTAVAFLTTRLKEPDTDDWDKIIRVLG